jgi:adenylate cyclase
MKHLVFIGFLWFSLVGVAISGHAQNSEADSLKNVLAGQEQDTSRVNTLLQLAWNLRAENPPESMKYSEEAKALSEKLNFDKGKAMAWSTIGVLQYRRGELVEAI